MKNDGVMTVQYVQKTTVAKLESLVYLSLHKTETSNSVRIPNCLL